MENNNRFRNQSNQRDWDKSEDFNDRNRNYDSGHQRSGSGFSQNFDYQGGGNRDRGRYNDRNNQYNDARGNYAGEQNSKDYGRGDDQGNRANDEFGNSNFNRNYGLGERSIYDNGGRNWWDRTTDEVSSWFGNDEAERRRYIDKTYGPHKGKGPKGYTRSDERIAEDINDKLYHDSYVDASNIEVKVSGGEAILSGAVDNREAKRRAEDIAESVAGIKNVQNLLKVSNTANFYERPGIGEAENSRKKNSLAN